MKLLLENWKSYLDEMIKIQDKEPKAPPPGVVPKRTREEQHKLNNFLKSLESKMKKDQTLVDKVRGLIQGMTEGEDFEQVKKLKTDVDSILASLRKELQNMKPSEMELMMRKIQNLVQKEYGGDK
jgi:hypothetical protein